MGKKRWVETFLATVWTQRERERVIVVVYHRVPIRKNELSAREFNAIRRSKGETLLLFYGGGSGHVS